ncbi:hypothetical protein B0H19DRAFT_1191782 [Mycena capillaripes]|nr:hypothetical protein B0H19DRAFT_1191782 [Mycena capillaripes]
MQQYTGPATESEAEAYLRRAKGYIDEAHAFFDRQQGLINEIHDQFNLHDRDLIKLAEKFHEQCQVSPKGRMSSGPIMLPSFIPRVPNGSEKGTYYGLEFRGKHVYVYMACLHGAGSFDLKRKKYDRPKDTEVGEASNLFNWLAECVYNFLVEYELDKHETGDDLPLGFTFPCPVLLHSLNAGTHLKWTKGYSADNSVGEDVVGLLQTALENRQKTTSSTVSVKCVALVNDAVGALMSQAYKTKGRCKFGAIFGPGTNGAYLKDYEARQEIVITEWGSFNPGNTLPSTEFDTLDPGRADLAFERMISGMYLGEITGKILLKLADAGILCAGPEGWKERLKNISVDQMDSIEMAWQKPQENLSDEGAKILRTAIAEKLTLTEDKDAATISRIMSAVKKDWEVECAWENPVPKYRETQPSEASLERRRAVQKMLTDPNYLNCEVSERDAAIVRWASSLVARRAALLSGVAVATVLILSKRAKLPEGKDFLMEPNEPIVFAVDGNTLFSSYPHFKFQETLRESLRIVVGDKVENRVKFETVGLENRVGAALAAFMAH